MDQQNEITTLPTAAAWEAHAQPLLHYLQGLTRDRELAEDLVQETFLRLAREELAGRTPQHTRGWLYRVASNLLASHGRRNQVARRELSRLWVGDMLASAEQEVSARDALRTAIAGAATLTRAERRTLALAAAEYSNAEMARTLGISEAAARTRLCRARANLSSAMAA
jgi:RNA polymerase sigma factor (sigma-70 family)